MTKNCICVTSLSFDAPLLRNPTNIRVNLIIPPQGGLGGLHFWSLILWVYFFRISVVSNEKRTTGIAECVMTVQGHPRSTTFVSYLKGFMRLHISAL